MATSFAFVDVKALVRQPQREQAQQLMQRLATDVLPILTRRRFRVQRLLEFFPTDGALLGMNVNRGGKIYVRLRPKRNPESFYPYEALLETLLHELTHMVHGPHNQDFYRYLDELKQEMESLLVRGLVGQEGVNFADAGVGQRLGGGNTGLPIRVAAVIAAKRRKQYHSLLGGETSRRLSSTASRSAQEVLDPQTLRRKVLEAAERRRLDNEHCRNVLCEGALHTVLGIESSDEDEDDRCDASGDGSDLQTAVELSTVEVIDLDGDDSAIASRTVDRSPVAFINLLDEQDEDDTPRHSNSLERERKRKQQESAADIIDLT